MIPGRLSPAEGQGRPAVGIGYAPRVLPVDTPDHPLGNTQQVSDLLAKSINQLRRGQLDPKVANAVGYLASVLLRSLEQGCTGERVAEVALTGCTVRVGEEVRRNSLNPVEIIAD